MTDDPGEAFVVDTARRLVPDDLPPAWTLGDDAARVDTETVVSTDAMLEGVHFDERTSAADLGWKLVAVNASDIAAMGCTPVWATLTLSLPRPLDRAYVAGFYDGLGQALERYGMRLVGGDTTRSPGPIVATLTVAGTGRRILPRSGARPGDDLWIAGLLGSAAAGFEGQVWGLPWLLRPDPPVSLGPRLAAIPGVHAMMDVTDGLHRDLGRMCRASGVGARVDALALPGVPEVLASPHRLRWQVGFGDDYALLFAADPGARQAIEALRRDVAITHIGSVTSGDEPVLEGGRDWPPAAFDHFGGP